MGQLEKYGLYVLCLLIFLIAGVSIWGAGELPKVPQQTPPVGLNAPANAGPPIDANAGRATRHAAGGPSRGAADLESLLSPEPRPKHEPAKPMPVDASGNKPPVTPVPVDNGASDNRIAKETPPAPQPPVRNTYRVKAGDTFESIAKTQLGNPSRHVEIAKLNPTVQPSKMQIGEVLVLPSSAAVATSPGRDVAKSGDVRSGGARTYTIGKGDTFDRIARVELGSAKRVEDLRRLNPTVDPTLLKLGQKINLPAR